MILHLAWKFVCKLSSSWLLIPQNLLIFSSQLMNNCSDWELFGNNLSCKKNKKNNNIYWRKKTPILSWGGLYWWRGRWLFETFSFFHTAAHVIVSYKKSMPWILWKWPHLTKEKETKKPKSFGFAIMLPFKSDLFYFIKRF